MKKKQINKPSIAWYSLPCFFGLIGGAVGYDIVKKRDRRMADNILLVGIITLLIFLLLLFLNLIFLYVGLPICGGILIGYEASRRVHGYLSFKRKYRGYVKKIENNTLHSTKSVKSTTRITLIIVAGGLIGFPLAVVLQLLIFSESLASVSYYNIYGLLMTMAVVAPFIEEPLKLLGFGLVKIPTKWTKWDAIKAGMYAGLLFGIFEASYKLYEIGSLGLLEPTYVLVLLPIGLHILASGFGGLGAYYGYKRDYGRMLKYIVLAIALHLIWNATGLLIGIIACVVAYGTLTKYRESKPEEPTEARGDQQKPSNSEDPLKVLKLRLARGEITRKEYGELKKVLEERPPKKRGRPRKDRRIKPKPKVTKAKRPPASKNTLSKISETIYDAFPKLRRKKEKK